MDSRSPEITSNVGAQAEPQTETPSAVPGLTPDKNAATANISRLNKILIKLGLREAPKPLIEVKPAVAPDSEGRARIDRNQLKQSLEKPSQS